MTKEIEEEAEKERIVSLLTSLWGEGSKKGFINYYKNKSLKETEESIYKLIAGYYGENTAKRMLNKEELKKEVVKKDKFNYYISSIIIYALLILAIYSLGGEAKGYKLVVAPLLLIITPLVVVIFSIPTLKYYGIKTVQGRNIILLLAGLLSWSLGYIFGFSNSASFGNIFFFIGYILLIMSFSYSIKIIDPKREFLKDKSKIFLVIISILFGSILYYHAIGITWNNELGGIQNITNFAYILSDIILIMFIFILIGLMRQGSYNITWWFLLFGLILDMIGNSFYVMNFNTYKVGYFIDLFWHYSSLCFAVSILYMKRIAELKLPIEIETQKDT